MFRLLGGRYSNPDPKETPEGIVKVTHAVHSVPHYSSQYGAELSSAYVAVNIIGPPTIYPMYGDASQACVFRTYGPWWEEAPHYMNKFGYQPKDFYATDFIDLSFEFCYILEAIHVYETYIPQPVIEVWVAEYYAPKESEDAGVSAPDVAEEIDWYCVYKNEPVTHSENVPYEFSPKIKRHEKPINLIRLVLCHRHAEYYTELDAVKIDGIVLKKFKGDKLYFYSPQLKIDCQSTTLLKPSEDELILQDLKSIKLGTEGQREEEDGEVQSSKRKSASSIFNFFKPKKHSQKKEEFKPNQIMEPELSIQNKDGVVSSEELVVDNIPETDNGYFETIPSELIAKIFSYLELPQLLRVACVCKLFKQHIYDPVRYTELDFQPYWHSLKSTDLDSLRQTGRLINLQKLSLKWCGYKYCKKMEAAFRALIDGCGENLTHLNLESCVFPQEDTLPNIAASCKDLKELNMGMCYKISKGNTKSPIPFEKYHNPYLHLTSLHKLTRLNLCRAQCRDDEICEILKNTPNMQHLNLGNVITIRSFAKVLYTLGEHCKDMRSLDVWRAKSLDPESLNFFTENCSNMEDFDFGWCGSIPSDSGCLKKLMENCMKTKRLILCAVRQVKDCDVKAASFFLRDLEQFDILGTNYVTPEAVEWVLEACQKLKMLDVSFCKNISAQHVLEWREKYPHVNIKMSQSGNV